MAYVANRPKQRSFKAENAQLINGIPHGDRILCGHNPWLYARKVSALKVVTKEEKGVEEVTWKEPPIYKWKNQSKMEIEIEKEGEVRLLIRSSECRVSNELETFFA